MKKGSLILALFLCLIAVGGLAVLFRANNTETPSDNNSSGGRRSSFAAPYVRCGSYCRRWRCGAFCRRVTLLCGVNVGLNRFYHRFGGFLYFLVSFHSSLFSL